MDPNFVDDANDHPLLTACAGLLVAACSSPAESCNDIVQQYEAAVTTAVTAVPNPCSVLFPVVVAQVLEDGGCE